MVCFFLFSDRRDSNPRLPPWQGGALPTEPLSHIYDAVLSRICNDKMYHTEEERICQGKKYNFSDFSYILVIAKNGETH